VPVGSNITLSNSAYDSIDGDFITYERINPLRDSLSDLPYIGKFSKERPLTFAGFPNQSLPLPQGFHFDSLSSNMRFKPVITNEATVVTVKLTEWRRINGVFEKIGYVIRDVQVLIINSANNLSPEFLYSQSSEIPVNCGVTGTYCYDIQVVDSNSSDTVKISYVHNIPNATITSVGTTPSKPILRVCGIVDSTMLSGKPEKYEIKIFAEDNHCPLPGRTEKTFYLQPTIKIPNAILLTKSLNCRNLNGRVNNFTGIRLNDTTWQIWGPNDTTIINGVSNVNKELKDTG